ncbi:MAG TPA: hypothetical protein VGL14_21510 [Methylomirabilota bacterium]|jgi:hypothetical protein
MRGVVLAFGLFVVGVAIAGCETEKQWMKVGESYTTNEFRRDYGECSKSGRLDEDCMRARGWVEMKPSKGDRAADSPTPSPQYSRPPKTR